MKKRLILILFAFAGGYFFRHISSPPAWLTPNIFINHVTGINTAPGNQEFTTKVSYKDGYFYPAEVTVAKGNYLRIINESEDALMWLDSNHPKLKTPRGYALSEQVKARMDEAGDFSVTNKLNLAVNLKISVTE